MTVAIILMYFTVPALLIFFCQKFPVLDKLGVVVMAFLAGIVLALLGVIPTEVASSDLKETLLSVSVALALPLLVFSIDVVAALRIAGDTLKGMALALLSVVVIGTVAAILFAPHLPLVWQVAGLSVGTYTGGGPNMAAIKIAIDADTAVFTDMLTYDIFLSAVYVFFAITFAKPIFSKFLKPYVEPQQAQTDTRFDHLSDDSANAYRALVQRETLPKTFLALVLSALIVALSTVLSKLIDGPFSSAFVIISITTLGVLSSFSPEIRRLPNSYPLGMYLILVFCFVSGTMMDTGIFTEIKWALFGYISTVILGSLILHAILCRIFKIDVDTFITSASASIMSVPFIPVIAGALKNRYVLVPGLAAAIIGYILGNYLGVMVAWSVRSMLGL